MKIEQIGNVILGEIGEIRGRITLERATIGSTIEKMV